MNIVRKREALVLLVGDIFVLFISLYLTITLRYGVLPSGQLLEWHLAPFSFLFLVSILLNFISGLYEKHTLVLKSKLPGILTRVQIINTIISIAFFYFIPYFVITPKITLFVYLIISLVIMVPWRMAMAESYGSRGKYKALLLASHNDDVDDLYHEFNNNQRYGTTFVEFIDLNKADLNGQKIIDIVRENNVSLIVTNFSNPKVSEVMPVLYSLIFSGVQFADIQTIYEGVFDRVPLSLVNDSWFLRNISTPSKFSFDFFKRAMDIVVSGIVGIISLIVYPFVYIAIKLDDRGPLFIVQERIGRNNEIIHIRKFRSMTMNDQGDFDPKKNKITRTGSFLRKTRIDELPQLWSVFSGELSLIGPRPELPALVKVYEKEIPYYNMRHILKPGLSGWAQIYGEHQHHGVGTSETKNKLSYDLYYIKNRSIGLDLKIALQTINVLFSFVGR